MRFGKMPSSCVWLGSWLAFWLVWFGFWLVWFGFYLHSPPGPYMCYMCYILHAKRGTSTLARVPCYMCYILHAKPRNLHSPPGPCYMYYMCYILCTREICPICAIGPCSTYSTFCKKPGVDVQWLALQDIAHIAHIARNPGRVDVRRVAPSPQFLHGFCMVFA